jgi:hypothetical protein
MRISKKIGYKSLIIPVHEDLEGDPLDMFVKVIKGYSQTLSKGIHYDSIMAYSGISEQAMTMESIGQRYEVTRERVRQIREVHVKGLRRIFQGYISNGVKCDSFVLSQVLNLRDIILKHILLTKLLISQELEKEGIHISEERWSHLKLFFKIFDVDYSTAVFTNPIYIARPVRNVKKILSNYFRIKKLFKDSKSLSLKYIKSKIKLPFAYIQAFLDIIPGVEKSGSQEYQLKITELSGSDVAYRVLKAAKKPMKLTDILEIVNTLRDTELDKLILCGDDRFKNIGLTGLWALSELDVNTDYIYELIIRALEHYGCPCNIKKIYGYIQEIRPDISFEAVSNMAIRFNKIHFLKLKDSSIILKSWKSKYKKSIKVDTIDRNNQHNRDCTFEKALCEALEGKCLSASELASYIANKTGLKFQGTMERVYKSEFVIKDTSGDVIRFTLVPNHKELLEEKIRNRRDPVIASIVDYFINENKEEISRIEIVDYILANHKVSVPFIYRLFDCGEFNVRQIIGKKISYVSLKA